MSRALAYFLLDPLHQVLLLALAGLVLLGLRRKRAGFRCLTLAGLWFFIVAVSPVPTWLISGLERTFLPLAPQGYAAGLPAKAHILVLGGGYTYSRSLPPNNQLSPASLGRLVEGVRLHRLIPDSKLVCSGASRISGYSQARMFSETAAFLGVRPEDTLMVTTPRYTEEEARDYLERFGDSHPLILVTDAVHMPRAVFWFRQYGMDPIPSPTNHRFKPDADRTEFPFRPAPGKMALMDLVLHEYAGLLYGYWKTRGQ
jgi:uncharacterized SAM-binding protein YcdF (DUF218 family)